MYLGCDVQLTGPRNFRRAAPDCPQGLPVDWETTEDQTLKMPLTGSLDYEQSPIFVLSHESLLLFITYLHNYTFSLAACGYVVQANVYDERRVTANGLPVGT